MTLEETMSCGRRCVQWLKHCLLVIETVGLEASVTLEVIFMIANIQTLGVPIRYASLPATISAAMGVVLIPTMGFVMDRWAKSKSAKALILIGTSSLQIVGNILIFIGNTIKLLYYDDDEPGWINGSTTSIWSNTTLPFTTANSTTSSWTYTTLPWTSPNSSSSLSTINSSLNSMFSSTYTSLANTTLAPMLMDVSAAMETVPPPAPFSGPELPIEEESVRYFAIFAMIGYLLLDCGYDSSNCFLKTFALASTQPKDHCSIIVKAVFVSSFGGCLIAILGSIGLGGLLTAGTNHDGSASQSAFVAGLCFFLLISGLITTLSTGFCCTLSNTPSVETFEASVESGEAAEKSPLIATRDSSHDLVSKHRASRGSVDISRNVLEKSMSGRFSGHVITSRKSLTAVPNHIIDHADLSPRKGIIGFIIRNKKQIQINIFAFFELGALYSFEVYAVNFVGYGIYDGNPLAPVGSEAYQNYLDGIEVGSQGTLIYYVVFTFCSSINEILLDKLGWKIEVLGASLIYVVVNLVCALTVKMWAYYLAAVWTGIFRAVVVTVPYILANKISLEQGSGRDSGVAIATVAAMLPLGFAVCSALMGPIIDVTGDPATPLYYTAVTAFLGAVVIVFLKSD